MARLAFERLGVAAFWTLPAGFEPRTPEQARMIARIARKQGGREGWKWGQKIDDALDEISGPGAPPSGRQ